MSFGGEGVPTGGGRTCVLHAVPELLCDVLASRLAAATCWQVRGVRGCSVRGGWPFNPVMGCLPCFRRAGYVDGFNLCRRRSADVLELLGTCFQPRRLLNRLWCGSAATRLNSCSRGRSKRDLRVGCERCGAGPLTLLWDASAPSWWLLGGPYLHVHRLLFSFAKSRLTVLTEMPKQAAICGFVQPSLTMRAAVSALLW